MSTYIKSNNSELVEIQNLKAGYNQSEILRGVSIKVKTGEIAVLIGPNGAGKSTVLKSFFKFADVYSGEILFKGRVINELKIPELIKLGICYVPQGRQIFPNMTVLENLQMGAFSINKDEIVRKRIDEVLIEFPFLKEKQQQIASQLSGGQQQMLAIARAVITKPELILLDEPSIGLSPKMTKEVYDKILDIKKQGSSFIIVEQNIKPAISIADRVYVLECGKIALQGDKKILNDKKIKDIYFRI